MIGVYRDWCRIRKVSKAQQSIDLKILLVIEHLSGEIDELRKVSSANWLFETSDCINEWTRRSAAVTSAEALASSCS